jgi:hypothetical protein
MKLITNNAPQHALNVGYNGKYIQGSINTEFLRLQINNHLNWTNHIDKLIHKLRGACYAFTSMCHIINTIRSVYLAYFHFIMKYGLTFCGNSSNSKTYSLYIRNLLD